MLRRIILALIGLLAVVKGSKWLFDGKRFPTLGIGSYIVIFEGTIMIAILRYDTYYFIHFH